MTRVTQLRKLHSEEFHDLYASTNTSMAKSGQTDIWGHVVRMGENTKAFEELRSENLMERNY